MPGIFYIVYCYACPCANQMHLVVLIRAYKSSRATIHNTAASARDVDYVTCCCARIRSATIQLVNTTTRDNHLVATGNGRTRSSQRCPPAIYRGYIAARHYDYVVVGTAIIRESSVKGLNSPTAHNDCTTLNTTSFKPSITTIRTRNNFRKSRGVICINLQSSLAHGTLVTIGSVYTAGRV